MAGFEFMAVDERIVAGAELDTSRRWKESNDGLYILRAKTLVVVVVVVVVVVKAIFCIREFLR